MDLLAGRYRLVEPVGRGGTAVVWRAVDELLKRTVAVKMLAPQLADDRTSRALIRAEAQTAARLNHPHVANVYDYGEAPAGGSRRVPYLVLEFVDGETLSGRLRRHGAMDWPDAVRTCADVAAALAATHAAGLVHRDVKPGNVLLSPSGVKLVDLGIALSVGAESVNGRGEVRGTPAYVAPEHLHGGAVVPASDVYGLGLVLVECLTGQPLRRTGLTRPDPVHPQVSAPVAPGVPDEISELCRRCLAPAPADRPTSAEAARLLVEAAGPATAARPLPVIGGPPAHAVPTTPAVPGPTLVAAARRGERRVRRPSRRAVLLGALPVIAVVGALTAQVPGLTAADETAEGAAANAAPVPAASGCLARYTSHQAADGTFTAGIAVTAVGGRSVSEPVLTFTLPAGQRLTGAGGTRAEQVGRTVTVPLPDPVGARPVTLTIRGTYDAAGTGTAGGFALDGVACEQASTSVTMAAPSPRAGRPTGDGRQGTQVGGVSDDRSGRVRGRPAGTTTRPTGTPRSGTATPSPTRSPSPEPGDPSATASPTPTSASPTPSTTPTTSSPEPSPSVDAGPTGTDPTP